MPTAPWARFGDAATISKQQGATSLITGLATSRAATECTAPAVAKAMTAGPRAAARPIRRFRRFLANWCLPTESTLRADNEIINIGSLRSEAYLCRFLCTPLPRGDERSRRGMLAFRGNRADVVQWQNIS